MIWNKFTFIQIRESTWLNFNLWSFSGFQRCREFNDWSFVKVRLTRSCLEQLLIPVGLYKEKLTTQPRNLYAEYISEAWDYVIPRFPMPWNTGSLIMTDINMVQKRNHSNSKSNT